MNSTKERGTTVAGHLFSSQVKVTPGICCMSAYLDIKESTTGEVSWYINEYVADGNCVFVR